MSIGTITLHQFLRLSLPPFSISSRFHSSILAAATILLGLAIALLPLRAAILLVGGAAFLALILIRPILNLYALIPVIPFSSLLAVSRGDFKVGLMEFILVLGLAVWLLQILASPTLFNKPLKIKTGPLTWAFLLFLGGAGLSWLEARSIGASLVETVKWVEMLLLYLFVINLLPVRQIKWVILVFIVTGLTQALLGLYQFIFKAGPDGFLLFEGRFLRAYGTFAQPNPYAGYLGLLLPLALSLTIWAFTSRPRDETSEVVETSELYRVLGNRVFMSLAFLLRAVSVSLPSGLLLAALYASQSRGAWLGFATAALAILLVRSQKSAILLTTLALVGAMISLVSSFEWRPSPTGSLEINSPYHAVIQRLADAISVLNVTNIAATPVTDANFANIERLAHWQAARAMWRDHPWVGVGFGNYAAAYPAYAVGRWFDPLGHAHNYLLNLGAETGLSGVVAYLIFWICAFGVLWKAIRRSDGFYKAAAVGGIGAMVHLHIHNLVDNLYVQGMYLHIAIVLGVVSVIYEQSKHK